MSGTEHIYDQPGAPYRLIQPHPASTVGNDLRPGLLASMRQESSPLFVTFFSARNISEIQVKLRETIRNKTGHAIDRQSDEQLVTIMRTIYLQFATHGNTTTHVLREVERLNEFVLREIVPQVSSALAQYLAYLKDASSLPEPMARGQSTSITGSNTLEMFRPL